MPFAERIFNQKLAKEALKFCIPLSAIFLILNLYQGQSVDRSLIAFAITLSGGFVILYVVFGIARFVIGRNTLWKDEWSDSNK